MLYLSGVEPISFPYIRTRTFESQYLNLNHASMAGPALGPGPGTLPALPSILSRSMSLKSFFSRKKSRPSSTKSTQLSQGLPSPERFRESGPASSPPILRLGLIQIHPSRPPDHPVPWSVHRLNLLPPTFLRKNAPTSELSPSPFPRFGHALSATASAAGELFLFGGFADGSPRNDFYAFSWWELSATLSATLLETSGEVPSPRLRHAGTRFGTVLLIWGGATNFNDQDQIIGPYDDSLYLLNIGTLDLLMSRPTLAD